MTESRPAPGGMFGRIGAQLEQAEAAEQRPTMNMMALVDLPAEQRSLVRHVLRADTPPTTAECAEALQRPLAEVEATVGELLLIGLLDRTGDHLRAVPGWRSSRLPPGGVWSSLGDL